MDRNRFIVSAGALAGVAALPGGARAEDSVTLPFANGQRPLAVFPQKKPLIVLTPRPPQLETPMSVFDRGVLTPNDQFFVRWHLSGIPRSVDASTHRIAVTGAVSKPLSLSLDDLQQMHAVDVVAVNQCSGNSRGHVSPRVPGGQWDNGAMGNARWTGVRLRDILDRAGITSEAKQIQFAGLEKPPLPTTPAFKKSLDVSVARGDDVIVAYAMNGQPLPLLNGYPVRLVVAGWYSTYWVKMLSAITVLDHVDDNFWMKTAYRIPDTPTGGVPPGTTTFASVPINRMVVRSFVTNVVNGATLKSGEVVMRGIAFDGGSGIKRVETSSDGGTTWREADLEQDFGKYSFRRWNTSWMMAPGSYTFAVRATGNDNAVQTATAIWNPSGYMLNPIETYQVTIV